MTIVEALTQWLARCPGIATASAAVLIDRTDSGGGVSVSASGQEVIRRYLDGSRLIQATYALYITDAADDNEQRTANNALLEEVFAWVTANPRNLPTLPPGMTARRVTPSNGMIYGVDESGAATYQIQIAVEYYREGHR